MKNPKSEAEIRIMGWEIVGFGFAAAGIAALSTCWYFIPDEFGITAIIGFILSIVALIVTYAHLYQSIRLIVYSK